MEGAIFCSECGMQLIADSMTTQAIDRSKSVTSEFPAPPEAVAQRTTQTAWASLYLLESGHILPLGDRNEYTLGRASDGQPITPDIDLTPYQAYENGVSRLHVVIKRIQGKIIIMDLGSSNGTYLNGARMTPNHEESVKHGDTVSLGKLKAQIICS
jgi:pSer/pThr/pTyr-binding forkhead associated (FHA) protein